MHLFRKCLDYLELLIVRINASTESYKNINIVLRCSAEKHKGVKIYCTAIVPLWFLTQQISIYALLAVN